MRNCKLIIDGGSTGTRAYFYDENNSQSIIEGPKINMFFSGKNEDTEIIDRLITLLDASSTTSTWREICQINKIMLYFTGGMRLKLQQISPDALNEFYKTMSSALNSAFNEKNSIGIDVRVITDHEEGIYAWIAQGHKIGMQHNPFGLLEMGGASTQITYPCVDQSSAYTVNLYNSSLIQLCTKSFFITAKSIAEKLFESSPPIECQHAAGANNISWTTNDCAQHLINADVFSNFIHFLQHEKFPLKMRWYLAGALQYYFGEKGRAFCNSETHKDPEEFKKLSCFNAVFVEKMLETMNISQAAVTDASWTHGAALVPIANIRKQPIHALTATDNETGIPDTCNITSIGFLENNVDVAIQSGKLGLLRGIANLSADALMHHDFSPSAIKKITFGIYWFGLVLMMFYEGINSSKQNNAFPSVFAKSILSATFFLMITAFLQLLTTCIKNTGGKAIQNGWNKTGKVLISLSNCIPLCIYAVNAIREGASMTAVGIAAGAFSQFAVETSGRVFLNPPTSQAPSSSP